MKQVDFFASYSTEDLEQLIDKMEKKKFTPGDVIIQKGSTGEFFFIIKDGAVSVLVEINGESKLITHLGNEEYFGEMSLLTGQSCVASVKAETDGVLFLMHPDDFRLVLMHNPVLVDSVSSVIRKRRSEIGEALGKNLINTDDFLNKIKKYFQLRK